MAAALISGILNQLVTIAIEEGKKHVKLVTEFDDEVAKLRTNLEAIEALLEDAEEKQLTDRTVKLWLNRLKEAFYDMDDVLDEWSTTLLTWEAEGQEKPPNADAEGQEMAKNASAFRRKVRDLISCCSPTQVVTRPTQIVTHPSRIVTRHDLAVKIKEINGRLDEIAKEKNSFQLTPREIRQHHPRRPETTSFVDVSKLHGRDEIKTEIMESLLGKTENGGSDLQTISIVGMGGLGKTALAQLIYNDSQVAQRFHKRIWVCVSDLFEEKRVAKAIIVALEGLDHNSVFLLDSVPLQGLLERICRSIYGKRFLLVLDDVWTEDDKDWESLKQTFKHGAARSKILVTTRKEAVAKMMESSETFHLEQLSEEHCWLVLSQAAFLGRGKRERENLEGIGREIARKCKGLPLAAKTLGSLLRDKKTREEWLNVLNSEVWKLDLAQKDIFAPLMLSYYDLPLKIRQCFVYCAVFPKDFVIWRHHIIHHWMAQGYLSLKSNPEMEMVGEEYLNYLADRSFFQNFSYDEDSRIETCKMHDIVHDFALYLGENELVTKNVSREGGSVLNLSYERAHHLTIMVAEGVHFPSSIIGTEKLRTFVTFSGDHAITTQALQSIATGSKRLRSLDLSWPPGDHLSKEVPPEIGKLMHLRHLNLSCSFKIQELPETICDLTNLIYLDLKECRRLKKLPEGIGKLIKLRYLRTTSCFRLTSYPKGARKLTSLRILTNVIVRTDRDHPQEFSIGDLENLTELRGLCMRLVGTGIDIGEARKSKIDNKIHLRDLRINLRASRNIEQHEVIEALNPPSTSNARFCTDTWWSY